jgi:hypothetical protein
MNRSRSQLCTVAGRLGAIGGWVGIAAGVTQAIIGSRIPNWTGNKDHPVALGLLTIALGASVLVAVRTLRAAPVPRYETLSAITLWLVVVAVVCSTTVGMLWIIPGVVLLAAAGVALAACGWHQFRSVIATNWLRGLLGILGALELLMAVSAAPTITVAAGLVAGGALIAAAVVLTNSGRQALVSGLVAATLPFAALTWWTIVTPLLTVVAFVIGVAATRGSVLRADAVGAARFDPHAVR